MKLLTWTMVLALGLFMMGCPGGDDDDDASGDFYAGSFMFSTVGVDDACTDGALEVIYMPDGSDVPSEWQYPVELPAFEDCPVDVAIQLQDPFKDITVTMTSPGEDQFAIESEDMLGVELDPDTYEECVVDYNIDALLTLQDTDTLSGTVTLHTSNWVGANCPQVDSDPCDITLDIEVVREL